MTTQREREPGASAAGTGAAVEVVGAGGVVLARVVLAAPGVNVRVVPAEAVHGDASASVKARRCAACGRVLREELRADARTCGHSCRTRLWKARRTGAEAAPGPRDGGDAGAVARVAP